MPGMLWSTTTPGSAVQSNGSMVCMIGGCRQFAGKHRADEIDARPSRPSPRSASRRIRVWGQRWSAMAESPRSCDDDHHTKTWRAATPAPDRHDRADPAHHREMDALEGDGCPGKPRGHTRAMACAEQARLVRPHQIGKTLEQIMAVARAGRGLGVVLHREHRPVRRAAMPQLEPSNSEMCVSSRPPAGCPGRPRSRGSSR